MGSLVWFPVNRFRILTLNNGGKPIELFSPPPLRHPGNAEAKTTVGQFLHALDTSQDTKEDYCEETVWQVICQRKPF